MTGGEVGATGIVENFDVTKRGVQNKVAVVVDDVNLEGDGGRERGCAEGGEALVQSQMIAVGDDVEFNFHEAKKYEKMTG